GFWAMNKSEEIPVEGLSVKFLIRMEYVTKETLSGVKDDMTLEEKQVLMADNIKGLVDQATKGNNYRAVVEEFFGGNEYYLFVYETFTDVRLAGTPPESIGKFGADTDNWMWPRHTGDFSVFRVYTGPDGNPADYASENVPLKPKYYLPVSIGGIKEGDFALIMGYPGSTERYLSSYGVNLAVNQTNMTIVDIRAEKLRIMKEGMDADPEVRLQYASKYARTSNYWKYFIGQTKGLKKLKVKDKKLAEEEAFTAWLASNPEAKLKYGNALKLTAAAYEIIGQYNLANWYYKEAIQRGAEIFTYANSFNQLSKLLNSKDSKPEEIQKEVDKLKENAKGYFKDYNQVIDRNLLASMLSMYFENVPLDQQPVYLLEIDKKFKGNFDAYATEVFEKSIFASPERVNNFLANPKAKTLDKDPALTAMNAFVAKNKEIKAASKNAEEDLKLGSKLYIAGLREMNPDVNYSPDANFTMRVTYGIIEGYYPADAVYFNYYTTLDGVIQKDDPFVKEFTVPEKLKQLYKAKDYGPYGVDGVMPVAFLTNHDITGGNSGSPVLNASGELIGLAFDGNWEAMSGDIAFEPDLQRTICVDIRYVLFIIDKFGGAKNLVDEMTVIRERPKSTATKNIEKQAVLSETVGD
ncbi:MAG TPA: S46 family peptidase, partial [Bacteroidales bacterium]